MSLDLSGDIVGHLMDMAQTQANTVMIGLHQDLLSAFVIVKPDGGLAIIGAPWSSREEKIIALAMIQEEMRKLKAVAFSFVGEAWTATNPPDNPNDMTPASLRPPDQRKEVVMIFASDKHTKLIQWLDTVRNDQGQCIELKAGKREPATKDIYSGWVMDLL
jgi:hypothetical protein